MTDVVATAAGGLGLCGLLLVAFLAGRSLHQARGLDGIQRELESLRQEVVGYRSTHTHDTAQLDRRLDALEEATAHAVNEVRMASDQLVARLPAGSEGRCDRSHDG